jgi:hypothetical protein
MFLDFESLSGLDRASPTVLRTTPSIPAEIPTISNSPSSCENGQFYRTQAKSRETLIPTDSHVSDSGHSRWREASYSQFLNSNGLPVL